MVELEELFDVVVLDVVSKNKTPESPQVTLNSPFSASLLNPKSTNIKGLSSVDSKTPSQETETFSHNKSSKSYTIFPLIS